jgi:hypothetical protein
VAREEGGVGPGGVAGNPCPGHVLVVMSRGFLPRGAGLWADEPEEGRMKPTG